MPSHLSNRASSMSGGWIERTNGNRASLCQRLMPGLDGNGRKALDSLCCNLGGGNESSSSIIERSLKARFMCVIVGNFSGG